jgi:alpha-amylase
MGADIDHRHPEASDDLCNWGVWIMKELGDGAAGFRFDAVKVRLHLESSNLSRRVKD